MTGGGTEDMSDVKIVEIDVINAYVQLDFSSNDANILDDNALSLRTLIANNLSPPVPADSITVTRYGTSATAILNSAAYCAGNPLSVAVAPAGRRLHANSFSVVIFLTSLQDALALQQADKGFESLHQTVANQFSDTDSLAWRVHTADALRNAHFDITAQKITVNEYNGSVFPRTVERQGAASVVTLGDSENISMILEVANLVTNISASFDVEVDENGTEVLHLDVVPVAYRLFSDEDFVSADSTGGLVIDGQSSMQVSCAGARGDGAPDGRCTSANVTLGRVQQYFNGAVRYQITLRGTALKAVFELEVVPVNQLPSFEILPSFTLVEATADSEEVLVSNFAFNIATGPKYSAWSNRVQDEQGQYLEFTVTLLSQQIGNTFEGSSPLFLDLPTLLPIFGGDGVQPNATLAFTLTKGLHGSAVFSVSVRESGISVSPPGASTQTRNFTITVLPVNQRPSFRIPNRQITLVQDVSDQFIVMDNMATNILKGAGDELENEQLLSFQLSWSDPYQILGAPDPRMFANGTLIFTVGAMKLGNASFDVVLQDSGGRANFGVNLSQSATFSVLVRKRNYPPVFNVSRSLVKVCENYNTYNSKIFTHIMVAWHPDLVDQESDQSLTFDLKLIDRTSDLFMQPPSISDSGELTFVTAVNRFGNATFNVTLRDNAHDVDATLESLYAEKWVRLRIEILPNNDIPTFSLQNTSIVVPECDADKTFEFPGFAYDILPGLNLSRPLGEQDQNLTFVVTALQARVPARAQSQWDADASKLFTAGDLSQMFSPNPSVTVSADGTLMFRVVALRNGQARFKVVLQDDGDNEQCADGNGADGESVAQIFDITVEARNSAPTFSLSSKVVNKTDHSLPVLTIPETERMVTTVVKDVLVDITPGIWDEWDQALRFKVDLISGDESIVNDLRLVDGGSLDDCSISPPEFCPRTADLMLTQAAQRFGTFVLRMTVSDTGAEVQEGIDSSNISIVLEIAPVNNAPLLRLSTHSVVVSSDGGCGDIGMPPIDTVTDFTADVVLAGTSELDVALNVSKNTVQDDEFLSSVSDLVSISENASVLISKAAPCFTDLYPNKQTWNNTRQKMQRNRSRYRQRLMHGEEWFR